MKHVLLLITTVIALAFYAVAPAYAQQNRTLKSEMEVIHESLGVNFVYDSAIEINVPYSGKPMKDIIKGNKKEHSVLLEECLMTLFSGTNIEYEVMKKYVVLTQADKRKKPKDYTIFIEEQNDSIPEAVITALVDSQRNETQTGLTRIDGKSLNRGFALLSSPDLIKSIQMLPGVSSGTELMSGLYVHGGTGNDNLFQLDNVPMYQVSHLAGLFSSFNHEVIDNVDFYKSGFPARYGGRMSSVVDVMTRPGDMQGYHGSFSIGLIDGNIQFEGPIIKNRTSFNVALRRSWVDAVTTPVFALMNAKNKNEKTVLGYNFWDANAGITHLLNDSNKLYLNFYAGDDKLKNNEFYDSEFTDAYGDPQRTWFDSGINVTWGNILASAGWESKITDNLESNVLAFYSLNRSRMVSDWHARNGVLDVYEEQVSNGNISNISNVGVKSLFDWTPGTWNHVRFGGGYQYHMYDVNRVKQEEYKENDNLVSSTKSTDGKFYDGHEFYLYVEDEMQLTDWFTANAGLRYVLFGVPGKVYNALEPRFALKFKCSEALAIKASYTEMTQFNHQVATSYIDLPSNTWMPVTDKIDPMKAKQVAGGFYFTLPYGLSLNIEGWWKRMDYLREYIGGNTLFPPLNKWEASFAKGTGRSYGGEFEFAWRKSRFDFTAAYTLSWNERYFESIYRDWYPDRNDHRHKFTVSGTYKFGKRFEMYAAWHYHSGSRFTVASNVSSEQFDPSEDPGYGIIYFGPHDGFKHEYYYSSPNNVKMPAYHRLDAGFNFRKTTKRGNESIWNLSVYNAYCRMNPIWASVEYNGQGKFLGKAYGIIPIIPSFSYTLRF